ncbi:hypothetical protein MMC13_004923 [Lambiella insularis]|nr:hypothetical protein [Lambiella insularis]
MPLLIRPMTEADLPAIRDLLFLAFHSSSPAMRKLAPNGQSPSAAAASLAAVAKSVHAPAVVHRVVVDTDLIPAADPTTGATVHSTVPAEAGSTKEVPLVAYTRYYVHREERAPDVWDVPYKAVTAEETGEGVNVAFRNAFFEQIHELRRRNMQGRKHILVEILAASPLHERRGAGTMLLKEVFEVADTEGLDCWIDASPVGYPLYKRLGFQDVDFFETDVSEPSTLKEGESRTMYKTAGMLRRPESKV